MMRTLFRLSLPVHAVRPSQHGTGGIIIEVPAESVLEVQGESKIAGLNRPKFLTSAAVGATALQAQPKTRQTFLAGLVPDRTPGAGTNARAASPIPVDISWIFRVSVETPAAEALVRMLNVADAAGPNRGRLREAPARMQ